MIYLRSLWSKLINIVSSGLKPLECPIAVVYLICVDDTGVHVCEFSPHDLQFPCWHHNDDDYYYDDQYSGAVEDACAGDDSGGGSDVSLVGKFPETAETCWFQAPWK